MAGSAILLLIAVLLDRWLGEPRQWHPLVGLGAWASWTEKTFYGHQETSDEMRRWRGIMAVMTLVGISGAGAWALVSLPELGMVAEVLLVFLAIGAASLAEHAERVYQALDDEDLDAARQRVGYMVSRDTAEMNEFDVSRATVESVLENGNDAIFGAIFWYLLAGAPGVVIYRVANTLDAMWGYKTSRYHYFGWAAARLDDALNWVPARLCAFGYAISGDINRAFRSWRSQAKACESPNSGPVMTAGAGALGIALGGPARYHGEMKDRPVMGEGPAACKMDIPAALKLIDRALMIWLAVALLLWGLL